MNNIIENELPVQNFEKVLIDGAGDTAIDLMEVGLDSLLKDGLLKDVPVIGTAYAAGKVYSGIRDITLTKKILIFSQKVRRHEISINDQNNHFVELKADKKKLNKELEIILNYLDRHTKYTKSLVLANFYLHYIARDIDWGDFDFFAEIVDSVSIYDLKVLKIVYDRTFIPDGETYNPVALQRLRNQGLVEYHDGMAVVSQGAEEAYIAKINKIGDAFCNLGMDDNIWNIVMNDDIIC